MTTALSKEYRSRMVLFCHKKVYQKDLKGDYEARFAPRVQVRPFVLERDV
jgi:hypothetical protein